MKELHIPTLKTMLVKYKSIYNCGVSCFHLSLKTMLVKYKLQGHTPFIVSITDFKNNAC